MEYKIKDYWAFCELDTFNINGIQADYNDFGKKLDVSPETAEFYCCGDMKFFSKPATTAVLEKYGISVEEYNEIAEKLTEKLSFGRCEWCYR